MRGRRPHASPENVVTHPDHRRQVHGLPTTNNHPDQVTFVAGAGTTTTYVQGDRTLDMHHCPICGCVTHWESVKKKGAERIAVNARLMNPIEIADVPVRLLNGASTWTYLD
jgi:hypothetical protein